MWDMYRYDIAVGLGYATEAQKQKAKDLAVEYITAKFPYLGAEKGGGGNLYLETYLAMGLAGLNFPEHPDSQLWVSRSVTYVAKFLDTYFPDGARQREPALPRLVAGTGREIPARDAAPRERGPLRPPGRALGARLVHPLFLAAAFPHRRQNGHPGLGRFDLQQQWRQPLLLRPLDLRALLQGPRSGLLGPPAGLVGAQRKAPPGLQCRSRQPDQHPLARSAPADRPAAPEHLDLQRALRHGHPARWHGLRRRVLRLVQMRCQRRRAQRRRHGPHRPVCLRRAARARLDLRPLRQRHHLQRNRPGPQHGALQWRHRLRHRQRFLQRLRHLRHRRLRGRRHRLRHVPPAAIW